MWEKEQIIILIILILAAVWDVRHREFPVIWLLGLGMTAAGWAAWSQKEWSGMIVGLIFGVGLVVISFLTKQSLGYADSVIILILSIVMKSARLLTAVWLSFLLCAAVSAVILFRDRTSKKRRIAFLPFLVAGYIGGIILL